MADIVTIYFIDYFRKTLCTAQVAAVPVGECNGILGSPIRLLVYSSISNTNYCCNLSSKRINISPDYQENIEFNLMH